MGHVCWIGEAECFREKEGHTNRFFGGKENSSPGLREGHDGGSGVRGLKGQAEACGQKSY